MTSFKWRVCAFLCGATLAGSVPVCRAQPQAQSQEDFLSESGYPAPSQTPKEAALNFYEFLSFVRQPNRAAFPDPATLKRLVGSVSRAQFGALFTGANSRQAFPFLAQQALANSYDASSASSSAGQTIVSVTSTGAPPSREVVVVAQDGGFRVDVKATYGRWNTLSGPQLDAAWLSFTGLTSESSNPFEQAGENARRVSCQSNMKQMMLGVFQYAQDHDEKLPPARKWIDAILPYVRAEQVFQCPSLTLKGGGKGYGYAFNQNLSGLGQAAIASPATTVNIYETSNPSRNWFGPGTGRAYRHQGGSNIAFADGHVKWFGKGQESGVTFKP